MQNIITTSNKLLFDKIKPAVANKDWVSSKSNCKAIAKEIINAHAGEIKIRSEVGEGTEIIMTIPVDKSFTKEKEDIKNG